MADYPPAEWEDILCALSGNRTRIAYSPSSNAPSNRLPVSANKSKNANSNGTDSAKSANENEMRSPFVGEDFPELPYCTTIMPAATTTCSTIGKEKELYSKVEEAELYFRQEGIAQLLEMFPLVDFELIDQQFRQCDWDLFAAIDCLVTLASSSTSGDMTSGTKAASSNKKQQRAHKKLILPVDLRINAGQSQSRNGNSSKTSTSSRNRDYAITTSETSFQPRIGNVEDLRQSARDYAESRSEYFQRASKEFRRGGDRRGVASYYAEVGQSMGRRMREENLHAAFSQAHNLSREGILDLHYLTISEAETVLEHELSKPSWGTGKKRKLMVVTGRGTGRLFNAIDRFLKSKEDTTSSLAYEKCDGYFMLTLKQPLP